MTCIHHHHHQADSYKVIHIRLDLKVIHIVILVNKEKLTEYSVWCWLESVKGILPRYHQYDMSRKPVPARRLERQEN